MLALAFLFGLADGFFYPAFGGIVPLVVESHELASANTLIGISRQGSFVVGPALAGGIYGIAGSAAVFGFDSASFVVSALLLVLARPRAFAPAAVYLTVRGVFIGYAISIWGTLLMEEVPESKLARVTSLDFFGSTGLVPVGYALTAGLSQALAPDTILLVGFSLAALLWSAPLLVPKVRRAA